MTQLIKAELVKLRTTRTVPAALLALLAFTAVWTGYTILRAGVNGAPSLGTTASTVAILSIPRLSILFMLLIGVVVSTTEFRHRTATAAFLVTPRRTRVVLAKLVTVGVVGSAYAVAASSAVLVVALPWLAARGVPVDLANQGVLLILLGTLLAIPLYGLIGVAVGTLIPNQVAAIVTALGWLQLVEPLFLGGLWPSLIRWLFTGASAALSRAEVIDPHPQWLGAALLTCYALLLTVLGRRVLHRDLSR